jgi:hypothetical protein
MDIMQMSKDFEDTNTVSKFLTTAKVSKKYVEAAIKVSNMAKGRMKVINDIAMIINEVLMWSAATGRRKPISAWTLTGQEFIPINPEGATDEERNAIIDESQVMAYKVIREIVAAVQSGTSKGDEVLYRGIPIMIQAIPSEDIDIQYFDDSTQKNYAENKIINGVPFRRLHAEGVNAVMSDTEGNILYFDEEGNITDQESGGRPVLQGFRKVTVDKKTGKLLLTNKDNYATVLVSPKEIADRAKADAEAKGIEFTQSQYDYIVKRQEERIEKEVNDLYLLREKTLSRTGEPILLPITGGTFGIVEAKFIDMSETSIKSEDIGEMHTDNIKGEGAGLTYITLKNGNPSDRVYLQRANMPEDLIDKIVNVLFTDAKLKGGKTLSAKQRRDFAKIFLGPNPTLGAGYKVTPVYINLPIIDGIETLEISINGMYLDLEEEGSDEILREALKEQIKGTRDTFSAPLNYSSDYVNKDFIDYEINGDKITTKEVDYFTFIKPFIKILYTQESAPYIQARNAYLSYAIPTDVLSDIEIEEKEEEAPAVKGKITKTAEKDTTEEEDVTENIGKITFSEHKTAGYAPVKQAVIAMADLVLAFNPANVTGGSNTVTQNAVDSTGKPYFPQTFSKRGGKLELTPAAINNLVIQINASPGGVLTITGGDITALKGYTQDVLDNFMYNTLKAVVESSNLKLEITNVITTGQTGIEEAATKAAARLGLETKVVAPKDWWTKEMSKPVNKFAKGKKAAPDRRSKETKFKARFKTKATPSKTAAKTVAKTKEVLSEEDRKILSESAINFSGFNRSMSVASFFDKYFVTEADKKRADNWWSNSPLSTAKDKEGNLLIPVTVITEILNSDAFATWSRAGITLNQADGGTSVDLYHEAWHAFSQLYLSIDEKTALYEAMRKSPKWANAEFIDIEEAIAEDFRDFMLGKTKPKGIIGRIFDRIARAIRLLFGKLTKRDLTRPRDIAEVKGYFDALYKGDINHLTPAIENVMPEFNVLNRSKAIEVIKSESKNYSPFTIDDSKRAVDAMDSIMADVFLDYNAYFKTTAGVSRILNDGLNREKTYAKILERLILKRDIAQRELKELASENRQSDTPDLDTQAVLSDNVLLLSKMVDNFGDIDISLKGKEKKGLVAYHINNTRFNVLKDTYVEVDEDEAAIDSVGQIIPSTEGNTKSSKELASEDTLMLISSIFKVDKNKDGTFTRVQDKLGFDILESKDIMWNKLARTLAGSLTDEEIYVKLMEYSKNYPEFNQLMEMLHNPLSSESYKSTAEFNTTTRFWQDFKKPRIPYVQLNITKRQVASLEEGIPDKTEFSSSIVNANFDVYAVFKVWSANFQLADPSPNNFITKDKLSNILDIDLIISEFSKGDKFDFKRSFEFLEALGITLDRTSAEISAMMEKSGFAKVYGVDYIFSLLKMINKAAKSDDLKKVAAAKEFSRNPIKYLMDGLPEDLRESAENAEDVRTRLRELAEINIKFSDNYANFSVLSPERNRVWEHFLDSTLTRTMGALNKAKSFKYLIDEDEQEFDVDGDFRHMRWLRDSNNPHIKHSVNMNSIFYMDPMNSKFGERRRVSDEGFNELEVINVAGTQVLEEGSLTPEDGVSTSSADATTKFLQEMNTMLLRGVQEFMRHASKSMAQGIRARKVDTANFDNPGKETDYLYVDIADFRPARRGEGELEAFDIIKGYVAGELERIQRFKANLKDDSITDTELQMKNWAGYNRKVRKKDGTIVMAGEVFTAFDDVLTEDTKEMLYDIDGDLLEALDENDDLYQALKNDVDNYFDKQTKINLDVLSKARYVDPALTEVATQEGLTRKQVDEILIKAYTYNSWIHNYESVILTYGDLAQYNHEKEEFHKRNAGMTAPGRGFRADQRARDYINSSLFPRLYAQKKGYNIRNYDGRIHTAIIKEKTLNSIMYDEYKETLYQDILTRLKDNKTIKNKKDYAKKLSETEAKAYLGMEEGDGQGHVTLESYRMLKTLEGNWTDEQEELYKRIVNGDKLSVEDIIEYFPPYKLQYFGNIDTKGLSVTSFHKFSLAPLIPSVTGSAKLSALHDKMMKDNVDYVVFQSGSKVGHIAPDGKGDTIFDENGDLIKDSKFTVNKVFSEFLKNQTELNSTYKEKSIFSTQLRKLILEGLYERGVIQSTDETQITSDKVKRYIDNVFEYTNILKVELLEKIGYDEKTVDGKLVYTPRDKKSTEKLAELIRQELERDDTLGDHLIEGFIDVTEDGSLRNDLSLHPEAPKIEKLLLSVINKKIIKQKVKGEPLVQVSAAMYEGVFGSPIADLTNATEAQKKKYKGSNFLPTYHRKIIDLDALYKNASKESLKAALKTKERIQEEQSAYWTPTHQQALRDEIQYLKDVIAGRKPKVTTTTDGTTAAMKVMVALQGDFNYLLNLEHNDGEEIGTIDRLNEMIKEDSWLDKGTNRQAVTMAAVRIPVQGLNSMEFMEVYHFLPPEAGNIIIPPSEIVAKSGADFDIDKLTTFMPNISEDGTVKGRLLKKGKTKEESIQILKDAVAEARKNKESHTEIIKAQKAALENELIEDIKNILELPQNYPSLIRPNGTYILKPIADELAQYVMEYDPYKNMSSDSPNYKNVDENGVKTVKKVISPTRVLESGYNIYKHESNEIGKKTLGLGAIENTFNVIMNSLDAKMPATYLQGKSKTPRKMELLLRHHTTINKDGDEVISIASRYDVDNVHKVADLFSQSINGWVDVEKDAWIFFIQGNYELASTTLYLIKAGVPVKEAIFFVSQPLVREYVKEQRQGNSTFAEPLGKKSDSKSNVKKDAAYRVMKKAFDTPITSDKYYAQRRALSDKYFGEKDRNFNEAEMLELIKNSQVRQGKIEAEFFDKNGRMPLEAELEKLVKKAQTAANKIKYSGLSQLMFLHFLEIEQQIEGLTKLKINSNPDTKTDSTGADVELTESARKDLEDDTKIDQDLRTALRYDSVTSAMYNNDLILALLQPLMPLRYHPNLSEWIVTNLKMFKSNVDNTFGSGKIAQMIGTFRNDLVSMLLQNALRKFNLGPAYKGYNTSTKIPVNLVDNLKFGAYVKKNDQGQDTLYIDEMQLRQDFEYGLWKEGSEFEGSYEDRGLYALDSSYFKSNGTTNIAEYYAFVAEREYLRSIYSTEEISKTAEFNSELRGIKITKPELDKVAQARYAYEKILAMKALDNTYNPHKMFKDPENAYAVKFKELMQRDEEVYGGKLKKEYPVLSRLMLDTNSTESVFNLYLNEKDFTNSLSNLYNKNFADLANPGVVKVADPEENKLISDFFSRMPLMSLMQTGLNKTKMNFNNVVPLELYTDLMRDQGDMFMDILDDEEKVDTLLNRFFNLFINQNNMLNSEKSRFKELFFVNDLENIPRPKEARKKKEPRSNYIKATNTPNLYIYLDSEEEYKEMVAKHPDIVFVANSPRALMTDKTKIFEGQSRLSKIDESMTILFPTSNLALNDNFTGVKSKAFFAVKGLFEDAIEEIQHDLSRGVKIAFPKTGFGDVRLMPKELFVYLSKRLYEEFGYVNPGSTMYAEVVEMIAEEQGISDAEIEFNFDEENNPFKCKI